MCDMLLGMQKLHVAGLQTLCVMPEMQQGADAVSDMQEEDIIDRACIFWRMIVE